MPWKHPVYKAYELELNKEICRCCGWKFGEHYGYEGADCPFERFPDEHRFKRKLKTKVIIIAG